MSQHDQLHFAARIRDPEAVERLPGISAARMTVYEQLFFNNLEGFLASGFPVLCSLFDPSRWQRLVRDFMRQHRCRTPYFLQIGEEFVAWLEDGFSAEADDPAFLAELAHYERIELALEVASDPLPQHGWSALAWPLAYAWPVQRLGSDYRPAVPPAEPTCLLAWRDRQERVRFQQLSAFAYHLALRLQAGEPSHEALLDLAESSGLRADKHYFANARALLDDWQRQDIWFPPAP